MRKKLMLPFYFLVVVSGAVVIKADRPSRSKGAGCCKMAHPAKADKTTPAFYYITEGFLKLNA
jgi:hypothetical protein